MPNVVNNEICKPHIFTAMETRAFWLTCFLKRTRKSYKTLTDEMNLLDIPSEVWQRILIDWIKLPEIVRFNLATTPFKSSNPLRFRCVDHLFSFDDNGKLSSEHLGKLLAWFQSRNVHLCQISVRTSEWEPWNKILKWTGRTVRKLVITSVSPRIVQSAAIFCTNLEDLHLHSCSTTNGHLHSILYNNASTLRSFQLLDTGLTDDLVSELPKMMNLSELSLITSKNSVMVPIISKCAELSVLHLQGSILDEDLALCITYSCEKLKRLHLDGLNYIDDYALPMIANGCRLIEGLQINNCGDCTSGLDWAIPLWRNLHMLLLDVWSEELLIAMAPYECPSLRVLEILEHDGCDNVDKVTVGGFRALAKGRPNLLALSIGTLCEHADVSSSSVLEYCAKLQYLEIGGGVLASLVDEILRSVGDYSPNLHTLNLSKNTFGCSPVMIESVLQQCTHLRVLMLSYGSEYEIADPLLERRVEVTRGKQVCLAKWVAPV